MAGLPFPLHTLTPHVSHFLLLGRPLKTAAVTLQTPKAVQELK